MQKLDGALLFVFLLAVPLSAQTVSGRVTPQADGSAVPGVTVSIEDLGMTTVTDIDGRYSLSVTSGKAGTVRVTAALQGFQTRTATVDLKGDAAQDFVLRACRSGRKSRWDRARSVRNRRKLCRSTSSRRR